MSNILKFIQSMKHSPVRNYGGIPGLTSWLIGTTKEGGLIRLMECSRDHQEPITPHSHRFDFECVVLAGRVRNLIWQECPSEFGGDKFRSTKLIYGGEPGQYERETGDVAAWYFTEKTYGLNDEYSMRADQVHSIFFAKGTSVLFFEGPPVSNASIILEPFVDGEALPTFRVEPWMFKRDAKGGAA